MEYAPRQDPVRFRRSRLRMFLTGSGIDFSLYLPLWVVSLVGIILRMAARRALRAARYRQRICLHCGYDLGGTIGDVCSECGHAIHHPRPILSRWLTSPGLRGLAVYVTAALLWTCTSTFFLFAFESALGPAYSDVADTIAQLSGPAALVLSPYWPVLSVSHMEVAGAVLLVALGWAAWSFVLLRTRLRDASLGVHAALAVAWFCVGPFVGGGVIWFVMVRK